MEQRGERKRRGEREGKGCIPLVVAMGSRWERQYPRTIHHLHMECLHWMLVNKKTKEGRERGGR